MNKQFMDLFQLLVELKNDTSTDKSFIREIEKNIYFVKQIIEEPEKFATKKKNVILRVIALVFKILNPP